ncbi:MAG: hypothetical protein Q8L15_08810 [Methylobacter sp.]|nr:hypothetical protein [Methylobacter sp.]
MPAMMELQLRNHGSNVAGAARSYGIIVLNLPALDASLVPLGIFVFFVLFVDHLPFLN